MTDFEKAEEQCKKDFCTCCLSFGKCEKNIALCSKATNYCKSLLIAELKKKIDCYKSLESDLYNTEANLQRMNIYCENLEKENEQLKEQNTLFSTQLIACNERCKDLEKENEELKEQIEKMKNVGNCKHSMECAKWVERRIHHNDGKCCIGCDYWELIE